MCLPPQLTGALAALNQLNASAASECAANASREVGLALSATLRASAGHTDEPRMDNAIDAVGTTDANGAEVDGLYNGSVALEWLDAAVEAAEAGGEVAEAEELDALVRLEVTRQIPLPTPASPCLTAAGTPCHITSVSPSSRSSSCKSGSSSMASCRPSAPPPLPTSRCRSPRRSSGCYLRHRPLAGPRLLSSRRSRQGELRRLHLSPDPGPTVDAGAHPHIPLAQAYLAI